MSTVQVLVVRHADAGDRGRWAGADDRGRPLSPLGRAQADALVDTLVDHDVERLLSSPYRRCVETFEPAARKLGLTVATDDRLAEATGASALEVLRAAADGDALCTHGDVVGLLIESLRADGVALPARPAHPKGSMWVVRLRGGRGVGARHVPSPELG